MSFICGATRHKYLDWQLSPPFRTVSLLDVKVLESAGNKPREESGVTSSIFRTDSPNWKNVVLHFSSCAILIIVDAREVSENTSWEIDELKRRNLNYKTIYYVPNRNDHRPPEGAICVENDAQLRHECRHMLKWKRTLPKPNQPVSELAIGSEL